MPDYFPDFIAKTSHPIHSRELYENRRWYKEKTSEIYNQFNNNYIDLWYDVPYYGKVNRNGILMAPIRSSLEQAATFNLVTFDFVREAYEDFVFFMKRGLVQGKTTGNLKELLGDFKVKKSFNDSASTYTHYSFSAMKAFNAFVDASGEVILDFETYVCRFLKYLDLNNILFSYYSFFAGRATPINATGLAIELLNKNHDDDRSKNDFYKEPEFHKYVQIAANFGFRVNKNAPWMLIADLQSDVMTKQRKIKRQGKVNLLPGYMIKHFIPNADSLFEQHYVRVIARSMTLLKEALIHGYVKYQNSMVYLVDHGKVTCEPDNNFKTITTVDVRRTPSRILNIKTYKTSLSKRPASSKTSKIDLASHPKFNNSFYLKMFEKILKQEYSVRLDHKYRAFKKYFDKQTTSLSDDDYSSYLDILSLLESFYTSTKMFNFSTKKPLWTHPKSSLTTKKENIMIPNEKVIPNINKTVVEFYTELNDISNI